MRKLKQNVIKSSLLILGIILTVQLQAQIPAEYYAETEDLKGEQLKAQLNDIIDAHIEFPYTSKKTDVWDILKATDRDPQDTNNVILFYSSWSVNAAQEYNSGKGWTREHVWAKSRGDFGTTMGAGTDVHALRPCDISVNSARNNRWFGLADYEFIDKDGPTQCKTSDSLWYWEPKDEIKGDVARMLFYMAVRYEGENGEVDLELVDSLLTDKYSKAPLFNNLTLLLEWHENDPVDESEIYRNDVIYTFQQNRNPFIDRPEFAQLIWSEQKTKTFAEKWREFWSDLFK